MKKLLIIAFSLFYFGNLSAQTCTPDTTLADTIIVWPMPFDTLLNPTGGISDTAVVNQDFEFSLTFRPPSSVTLGSITAPLVSIDLPTEGGIANLPASLDYVCNPPNCIFKADSMSCLLLFGTPAEGDEGVYDLEISATIQTGVIPLNFVFPDNEFGIIPGNYFLHIQTTVAADNFLEKNVSMKVSPNPFSSHARLDVVSDICGKFQFVITDIVGERVHQEAIHLMQGENTLEFDGSNFPEGLYFYSITNGKVGVSGKMVVNR